MAIILLEILKIIGIILLSVLGILFLALLFILFMNIKFKISGRYFDEFGLNIYIEFLFRMFQFKFDLKNTDGKYQILILGIDYNKWKIFSKKLKKKIKRNKKYDKEKINKNFSKKTEIKEDKQKKRYNSEKIEQKKKGNTEKTVNNKSNGTKKTKNKIIKEKGSENKIKKYINKIKEIYRKVKKIKEENDIAEIIKLTKNFVIKIIKAFKFKKFDLYAKFGTNDPSQTGIIYGGICIITSFVPINGRFVPDFKNEVFETEFLTEGNTNLAKILLPLLVYILKKPIFKLITNTSDY